MFYQKALAKFKFLSHIDSHCLQAEIDTGEVAESANSLLFAMPFHVGAHFCMGAYKCDVVVVIKIGAYIHGVLILCGCLLSQFYGNPQT